MKATNDVSNRTIQRGNYDHSYSSDCFVNPESYDFYGRVWQGRSPRAYVFTNAGYVVAIVFDEYFAYCEQDALDEAVDSGKLDFLKIQDSELDDYKTSEDSEGNPEYEGIAFLGNASEPFDQENLDCFVVSVELFRDDPIILAVIESGSRDEAIEVLFDALARDKAEPYDDTLDGYHILNNAIDYLRSTN